MPQNEFNSAQVFPSCSWTAEGLARFIGHLGPEMAKRGVAVFFGTMERANESLVDASLQDAAVAPHVKGVGFQWAGKGAIAASTAATRTCRSTRPSRSAATGATTGATAATPGR